MQAICILIKLHYVQHSLVLLSCPIPPMLIARIEFNKFLPINAAIFKAELLGKLSDEPVCGLLVRCVEFFHILLRQLVHEADQLYVELFIAGQFCPEIFARQFHIEFWQSTIGHFFLPITITNNRDKAFLRLLCQLAGCHKVLFLLLTAISIENACTRFYCDGIDSVIPFHHNVHAFGQCFLTLGGQRWLSAQRIHCRRLFLPTRTQKQQELHQ